MVMQGAPGSPRDLREFIAPVVAEAAKLKQKPDILDITPGSDWPENVPNPGRIACIFEPAPEMIKALPPGTYNAIKKEAEKVVHDMGYTSSTLLDDVLSGKSASSAAAKDTDPQSPKANPAATRKSSWKTKYLGPALMAGAGMMTGGADISNTSPVQTPSAAVSALEGIGGDRRRSSPNRRDGTSLVEVLVAIAIIGILSGLTLSTIQRVRDSANEAKWKNNMRQVGLAIHNYESATGQFPTSNTYQPGPNGILVPHSWVVDILPYMEQDNLARLYDKTKPYDQQSDAVQNAIVPTLTHPSYPQEPGRMHLAAYSSVGNPSSNPDAINSKPQNVNRDYLLTQEPLDFNVAMPPQWVVNNAGLWQQNSPGTMLSITDGTSNTPMIGAHVHVEGNRDPFLLGKTRITGLMFGTELGQSRVNAGNLGNVYQKENFITNHVTPSDGPRHTEKHTTMFADGSVRTLAPTGPVGDSFYTDKAARFREMVNRSDGKTPPDDLSK